MQFSYWGGRGGRKDVHNLYLSLKLMKCVNNQQNKDILLCNQVTKYVLKKKYITYRRVIT